MYFKSHFDRVSRNEWARIISLDFNGSLVSMGYGDKQKRKDILFKQAVSSRERKTCHMSYHQDDRPKIIC